MELQELLQHCGEICQESYNCNAIILTEMCAQTRDSDALIGLEDVSQKSQ